MATCGASSSRCFTLCVCLAVLVQGNAHVVSKTDVKEREKRSGAGEDGLPVSIPVPIQPISVKRNQSSDGNRFTVRFRENVAGNVTVRIHDWVGPARGPDSVVEVADGEWIASFALVNNSSVGYLKPWFLIGSDDYDHMVAMGLNNSGSDPLYQNVTALPSVYVSPEREAAYEPGQDVNFTCALYGVVTEEMMAQSPPPAVYEISNLQPTFNGVDLETMEYKILIPKDDIYETGEPRIVNNRIQAWLTIKTGTHPLSGFLQVTTEVYETGGPVVRDIQVSRHVLVRPSNQSGVYPPGFLTIAKDDYRHLSKNGHELHQCRVGNVCPVSCYAVGEVSSIDVYEVKSSGVLEEVPSAKRSEVLPLDYRSIYWDFKSEENSGNSDGITTFQCQAHSYSGRVVTKLLDVLAEIDGSLDGEKSSMEVEGDVMDYYKKVTLKCAVHGRPLPDVTFFGGTHLNMYWDSPDNVTVTGTNEAIATKVVFISTDELERLVRGMRSGTAEAPSCGVFSITTGNLEQHYFEMPDMSLILNIP